MEPAAKSPFASRMTSAPGVPSGVAELPMVTAPVAALTVMPSAPARLRTPALLSETAPPRLTAPPPARPGPAVTVRAAFASLVLSTAPAAMCAACTASTASCAPPTAPAAIFADETAPSAMSPAITA